MKFSQFMATKFGRLLRIILGVALIAVGLQMKSTGGNFLAVFGLMPIASGVFDWCPVGPLLHMPLRGKAVRACKVDVKK